MSNLLAINVNDHIEKKNGLSYLSWAWAWAEVLKVDPAATWEAHEKDGLPFIAMPDTSALVKVAVTIKGHTKSCLLPVMNNRNQAIKNPDAFAVNTAIVRCLTKAIAMHGLGLYIYAGEDMPEGDEEPQRPAPRAPAKAQAVAERVGGTVEEIDAITLCAMIAEAKDDTRLQQLVAHAKALPEADKPMVRRAFDERRKMLAEVGQ